MFHVLDQNYFRSDELQELIASDPESQFVVPDVALLEMCKGPNWEYALRKSLSHLSACPGRVFHSRSVGESLTWELKERRSIEGHLLPIEFRKLIRLILIDVDAETSEAGIALLSSKMGSTQEEIQENELDHARNEESLKTRTNIMKSALGTTALKAFKNGTVDETTRLAIIRQVAVDLLRTHLKNEGWSDNAIKNFLKQRPLTYRFFALSVRHAVEWAKNNGLDSMSPEKITNDILDQEYVLIGSFFDRLLSKEVAVQRADADLRAILAADA